MLLSAKVYPSDSLASVIGAAVYTTKYNYISPSVFMPADYFLYSTYIHVHCILVHSVLN